MTEHKIEYRGVAVPDHVLSGNVLASAAVLAAFKQGVDGALDLTSDKTGPETVEWDYFCDEHDPFDPTAYFRRILKGQDRPSHFLDINSTQWINTDEDRDYVNRVYMPVRFEDLPYRVATAEYPIGDVDPL